jgi:hypothetical protein
MSIFLDTEDPGVSSLIEPVLLATDQPGRRIELRRAFTARIIGGCGGRPGRALRQLCRGSAPKWARPKGRVSEAHISLWSPTSPSARGVRYRQFASRHAPALSCAARRRNG